MRLVRGYGQRDFVVGEWEDGTVQLNCSWWRWSDPRKNPEPAPASRRLFQQHVAVLRGEKVPARIDTGVGFVTLENFNDPAMADIVHPPLDEYLN